MAVKAKILGTYLYVVCKIQACGLLYGGLNDREKQNFGRRG